MALEEQEHQVQYKDIMVELEGPMTTHKTILVVVAEEPVVLEQIMIIHGELLAETD